MSSDSGSGGSSSEDEQQHAADPQVTGANADPAILQLFWDLAALEQEERQTAAEALVTALVNSQKQHDAQHRPADSQPPGSLEQQAAAAAGGRQQRMEEALQCCSPHMAYGLKRLARGLASGRQGARQGFAAALAATLAHAAAGATGSQQSPLQQPFVSAAGVLALLDASLEVTGSMKGSDQRDTLLGRVFGLAALSRSGLVTAFPAAAAAGDAANACVALVAEQLVALLQRKSFLRESAAAALVELLQPLSPDQMKQVMAHAPRLASLLQLPAASASPEGLLLALRLWHNLPQATLQHCQLLPALPPSASPPPELFWQQPGAVPRGAVAAAAAGVFAAGHVQQLVPVLLATSGSYPRLHPVWGCLLALLVPGFVPVKVAAAADGAPSQQQQQRAAPDLQQLSSLWRHFVEGACFSSSHERKALALQLLQLLLPVLTPEAVPVVLGRQLLGCLDTAVRDRDSYLHASAKKCLDRLQQCAEHSMVVKGDTAQAAKLRMVLAAALQSHPRLQAVGSGSGKAAAKQQLLQGLDAAGIAAYVDQLSAAFVEAVAGQQGGAAAANGAAGGDGSSSDEEADVDKADDAGVDDSKAIQLLDQLSAALRFPAADSSTLCKGLSFLAAAAFLRLPASLDAASLGSLMAGGAAPTAGDDKKSKKSKKGKEASSDAAADVQLQAEQQVLRLAAGMPPGPSQQLRQHCAARLISLLHSLQHHAAAAGTAGSQQQQQGGGDGKQQPGSAPETKKQQKKAQAEREQAAAAAAKQAAWQQQDAVTTRLLQFVAAAGQLPGVELTADEDVVEMAGQLQQLEASISRHAAAALQQQGEQQPGRSAAAATRLRMSLQLVHQLQLQLLSGGLSAEAASSVVDDLEAALVRGLGMPTKGLGIGKAAAAAALAGSGSDDEGGGSSSSDDDEDDEEGAPAWQDVLLDLLLSLLSSSSAEGGAGAGGGRRGAIVAVPTAPLREACEGVFRVFAEEMTSQGLSDLLRILTQRASEVLKQRDEEDSEVEQSEEEDEQSGEEDEQSGGEEEASEEDGGDAGGDAASEEEEEEEGGKQAAAGNGASAGGDSSSDEGDAASDLDDDAMLRLDAQLGAAVRGMLARGGGSARERAAALLALQLRVASLLEEWLKKCPRSPLVVQVALPLLKALVAARGAGGNPTLADRLAGLVNKHLSRCRPVLPAADAAPAAAAAAGSDDEEQPQAARAAAEGAAAGLQGDVRKVLYHASREKDPRVAAAAGQALLVLLAAASEAGGTTAAIAQEAAAVALTDFFEKKKTRLQRPWCEQLLSRCPEALLGGANGGSSSSSALGVLLAAVAKARNDSVRAKAVQLLPVLLRSPTARQAAAVLAALRQQQAAVAAAVGAAVTGPYKAKDQHAAAVKAVVQLLQAVQKAGGADKRLAELLGPETVREAGKAVVVVKAAGVAPRVDSQLDRLVSVAGLQQLVAAGKADPARLALLKKNRAALEGKAAAGKPAAAAAAAADAPKQQQQKQQVKQKKQQKQQQADTPAAMEVDGDEPEAAAGAAAGGSKQEGKKHKKDKHRKEQRDAAAEQQDGEQQQAKKRKKQQQGDAAAAAADGEQSGGERKAGKGHGELGKKKHRHKQ